MLSEALALFIVVLATISAYKSFKWTWPGMPPGPWGLPVLGYLPFLNPMAPYLTLTELCDKFGRVFSVRLGQVSCVVLADPVLIRQAFARSEFAGRAPLFLTHGIMDGFGLICAEGDLWKCQRKFTAEFMRKFGLTNFKVSWRSSLSSWYKPRGTGS